MAPTFSDLPTEVVIQIVYEAVRVRTAQRAVRLRLVSRAFSEYTTEAILRTDILSRAHYGDDMLRDRVVYNNEQVYQEPPDSDMCTPLLVSYITQSIVKRQHTDPRSKHTYIRRLAMRLCELRGLDATDREVMTACVRKLVRWNLCALVPGQIQDLLQGTPDKNFSEASFPNDTLIGAVVFGDADLVGRLLSDPGLPNNTMEKLFVIMACMTAAIYQDDIPTMRLIPLEPLRPGARNWTTSCGVLLRHAAITGSASMFHALLDIIQDASIPLVPEAALYIEFAAIRAPSLRCHRRVMKLLSELAASSNPVVLLTLRRDYHGARRLVNAAASGHLDLVKFFANGGAAKVNPEGLVWFLTNEVPPGSDRFLGEPLFEAVTQGHVEVVRFLLNKGANVNWLFENSGYALHQAIRGGSFTMTKLLVDNGADVNLGVPPPLALAVFHEDIGILRYLLDQGAHLDGESHAGGWAMSFARALGLDSMVTELIRLGVREDTQMAWVPSRDEAARHPIPAYRYAQDYHDPGALEWYRLISHEGLRQARCLPIGQIPPLPAILWQPTKPYSSSSSSDPGSGPDSDMVE